jgi:hypothetical protein
MKACSRVTVSFCLLLVGLCLLIGCRSNSTDLLEAELRTRDNDVRELKDELYRRECENEALMREMHAVRQGGAARLTPEQAAQTYRLKQIAIGRGTGGVDNDNCPGDEALQVVVEPKDCDGHTIKAPGALHIEALAISPEGLKTPFSTWDVPPDQVRRSWRSGLFSTGYSLVLPWKEWPANEKVRVVARFSVSDGRLFEAEKDVTVHLTPENKRKPLPLMDPSTPGPDLSLPPESLPHPRKIELDGNLSRSWWRAPAGSVNAAPATPASPQQADIWHPKSAGSLTDSVQLLRPAPLEHPLGEDPGR